VRGLFRGTLVAQSPQLSLRGGEADAAIWRHCGGSHKAGEIASLRSQ